MAKENFTLQVADASEGEPEPEGFTPSDGGGRKRNGYSALNTQAPDAPAPWPPSYEEAVASKAATAPGAQLQPPNGKGVQASAPPVPEEGLETCSDNDGDTEGNIALTVCRVGVPKRVMRVPPDLNIVGFKRRAFKEEFKAGANIRVIHMGKMLPDTTRLDEASVGEGAVIHVMISSAKMNALAPEPSTNDEGYDTDEQVLRDHELARRLADGADPRDSDDEDEPVRPSQGTPAEFMLGFALGSMLGIIMLIWIFNRRTSNNYKRGIIFGILTNLLFQWNMGGFGDLPEEEGSQTATNTQQSNSGDPLNMLLGDWDDGVATADT